MRGRPGRPRERLRQHLQTPSRRQRNRGRLDKHQRLFPSRPTPLQAQPEQTVGWTEASIGTSADAELVAQGENLEQEVYA